MKIVLKPLSFIIVIKSILAIDIALGANTEKSSELENETRTSFNVKAGKVPNHGENWVVVAGANARLPSLQISDSVLSLQGSFGAKYDTEGTGSISANSVINLPRLATSQLRNCYLYFDSGATSSVRAKTSAAVSTSPSNSTTADNTTSHEQEVSFSPSFKGQSGPMCELDKLLGSRWSLVSRAVIEGKAGYSLQVKSNEGLPIAQARGVAQMNVHSDKFELSLLILNSRGRNSDAVRNLGSLQGEITAGKNGKTKLGVQTFYTSTPSRELANPRISSTVRSPTVGAYLYLERRSNNSESQLERLDSDVVIPAL